MSIINKPDLSIFADEAKTGEIETFPNVLRGWGVTLEQTAGKPPMEWFNALGKRTDEWLMYLTQRGIAEWDEKIDYPAGAMTQYGGVFYVATAESKNEQPDRSQNSWVLFVDKIDAIKKSAISDSTTSTSRETVASSLAIKTTYDAATAAQTTANGKVSSVNGKFAEVVLNAADVGAYTQAEADAMYIQSIRLGTQGTFWWPGKDQIYTIPAGYVMTGAYINQTGYPQDFFARPLQMRIGSTWYTTEVS